MKGYTLPRTPKGISSMVPHPPWHYVGDILAVEFTAEIEKIAPYLPEGLECSTDQCTAYFVDWQYSSETGQDYLDPAYSQYQETIILVSANYKGQDVAYCPYIWVNQDKALLRGLIQGWPKKLGDTWVTRSYPLASKASPVLGKGGQFGAALSENGRRLAEARITLAETTDQLPSPTFAGAVLVRYFPHLTQDRHDDPAVHELVQLKSRDVSISPIWKGNAELTFFENPHNELTDLKPISVLNGFRFTATITVDDLLMLETL